MPRGPSKFPAIIAVRLTIEDQAKVRELSLVSRRTPADVLRQLIRLAEANDVPCLRFATVEADTSAARICIGTEG